MNKNKYKNYESLLDKHFGKLTKKASKISKNIQFDTQLETSPKQFITEATPEDELKKILS